MITIEETVGSREHGPGTVTLHAVLRGTYDDAAARAALIAWAPRRYLGLQRGEVSLEPEYVDVARGQGVWKCTVPYGRAEVRESGDSTYSFDTTGGTQHITQSIETVARYGPKASAKLRGAIGYDGKSVQGVDITVPVYNFTETHWFSNDEMTPAFREAIFNCTGCVNSGAFHGRSAGEVLFLGASGSREGDDEDDLWQITFRFAASPNRTDIMVGDIGPISKKGWEYLWVQYADEEDEATSQIVKKPIAAYVERVYRLADFNTMTLNDPGSTETATGTGTTTPHTTTEPATTTATTPETTGGE